MGLKAPHDDGYEECACWCDLMSGRHCHEEGCEHPVDWWGQPCKNDWHEEAMSWDCPTCMKCSQPSSHPHTHIPAR